MQAQERWVAWVPVPSQLEVDNRTYRKTAMRRISEDDVGTGCRRAPQSAAANASTDATAGPERELMPVPVGGSSSSMAQAAAIPVPPRVVPATAPASLEHHPAFSGSLAPSSSSGRGRGHGRG
jgi:hypothetical protein